VLWGIARLRRSRLAAYMMWDHALLVDIFFVQVFAFIQSQFGACLGFVLDIVLLISIRFMAARERELARATTTPEELEPALAPAVPAGPRDRLPQPRLVRRLPPPGVRGVPAAPARARTAAGGLPLPLPPLPGADRLRQGRPCRVRRRGPAEP